MSTNGKHSGGEIFYKGQRVKTLVGPDKWKMATVTEVDEFFTGVVQGQTLTVKLDSGETRIYTNHQVEAV